MMSTIIGTADRPLPIPGSQKVVPRLLDTENDLYRHSTTATRGCCVTVSSRPDETYVNKDLYRDCQGQKGSLWSARTCKSPRNECRRWWYCVSPLNSPRNCWRAAWWQSRSSASRAANAGFPSITLSWCSGDRKYLHGSRLSAIHARLPLLKKCVLSA